MHNHNTILRDYFSQKHVLPFQSVYHTCLHVPLSGSDTYITLTVPLL